jgi:hypothetical protein
MLGKCGIDDLASATGLWRHRRLITGISMAEREPERCET